MKTARNWSRVDVHESIRVKGNFYKGSSYSSSASIGSAMQLRPIRWLLHTHVQLFLFMLLHTYTGVADDKLVPALQTYVFLKLSCFLPTFCAHSLHDF